MTCCRADGVHPLHDTKSTTVATKAVSQVAADDESTQILKALNGVRLHRESREGRSYQCCCESGSTLGSMGLSSLVTRIRTRMNVSTYLVYSGRNWKTLHCERWSETPQSFLLFVCELSCEFLNVFGALPINEFDLPGIGDSNPFCGILLMSCVCLHLLFSGQLKRRS